MKKVLALGTLAATLAAALSACGTSLGMTCNDYLGKSAVDQKTVAQKYLEEVAGKKKPGSFALTATETALNVYCKSHGDTQIKDIHI